MPYLDSRDIANRALQHVGGSHIGDVNEDSKNNTETAFSYDKVRRAELRRNVWRFAIRKAVLRAVDLDTMILAPQLYDADATYLPGAIVSDANGLLWSSVWPDNRNNTPGVTDAWEQYFGPLTLTPWNASTGYYAGELVYKASSPAGSFKVFMSLLNGNTDTPDVADAYSSTTIYHRNAVVSSGGSRWRSRIEVNLGITPADGPLDYDNTSVYSTGQTVTGQDNFIYTSAIDDNAGNDPVVDDGTHWTPTNVANAWSRSPEPDVSASSWRNIAAEIKNLIFAYPIGSGPSSQSATKNVFRLPAGFLREAPQSPKSGSSSFVGAPSNSIYADWEYAGDFIVTDEGGPLIYRFVADITDVSEMDDMYCEGLAARIAAAICEPITQSGAKLQTIASIYKYFMSEARTVNAIEQGPVEPPLDDYISCRS